MDRQSQLKEGVFQSRRNLLIFEGATGEEEVTEDGKEWVQWATGAERVLGRTKKALPLVCKAQRWGFTAAQVAGREDGN